MPEDTIGRIDLRYVAKQTFYVNLCQDLVRLQIAQAVQKELKIQRSLIALVF